MRAAEAGIRESGIGNRAGPGTRDSGPADSRSGAYAAYDSLFPISRFPSLQQRIRRLQILHFQRAGGTLQRELVDHEGVARLRVVALRLEQVLLADQHVHDRARADFEAGLRGLQRLLRRNHRLLLRFHLADAGLNRIERAAGIAHHVAAILLEDVALLVALRDGLPHLRLHETAGEDRYLHHQSHHGVVALAVESTGREPGGGRRAPGRGITVADLRVQGRQVTRARDVDAAVRGRHLIALRL